MLKRLYTSTHSIQRVLHRPQTGRVAGKVASIKLSNGSFYDPPKNSLVCVTRAISARVNQNFDGFPSKELRAAHKSFIARPVFVNHNNEDHRRTRGIIIDSTYKESGNDKYIELLLEIDAKTFPKLAALISTGELDSVSMGTDVEFTRCSYCNNKAFEVEDFCNHVRNNKGQTLSKIGANGKPEKVLVYESCHGLNFFEISYVFDPADESAVVSKVYTPKHSKVAAMQKRSLGEVTAPQSVDTLRAQEDCPRCGDKGFNGDECDVCNYVRPPEELQDPDTMKSRVRQIVRKDPANNGKEGRHMPTALQQALARKRLEIAQQRVADADTTTDQARESDSTDVTNIDQEFTSAEDARKPDDTTDVTDLPDGYKSSSAQVARNRQAYLKRKADFGQDDPSQAPGADPQAGAPSDSDGPNSGPPSDDTPGESGGIDGLPIDWKQDESGQPYGTVQGTDLDIFVNEDMSWQVLPEGSNDPVAQGQGTSYDDCVQQAFQQAQSLGQQDPSQDPSAGGDPSAPPEQDPTKVSRRKRAQGDTPDGAAPDERTDVEKLPSYETLQDGGGTYNPSDYDANAFRDKTTPVDGSDVQNFAPGGTSFKDNNKSARKTSAARAVELVELYQSFNIVDNNRIAKFKAVGQIENLPAAVVNDRIALLSQVEAAAGKAAARPRNVVPQRAAVKLPNMGRAASFNPKASEASSDDSLLFISN